MSFGAQLRSAREAAGLSQQELAEKASIAIDSIQNWEQGRTRPRLPALAKLAQTLGVSLDVLVIDGEGQSEGQRRRGRPRKTNAAPSEPPTDQSAAKRAAKPTRKAASSRAGQKKGRKRKGG